MPAAHGCTIADAAVQPVGDGELEALLARVYVDGGFTAAAMATTVFTAAPVRARGRLFGAREAATGALLGMVILAAPTSPARRIATADEAELHLLAVAAAGRGRGIGRALVEVAIAAARDAHHARLVLWTQPAMVAAQRLYAALGFVRAPARDWRRGEQVFLVYELAL